MTKFGDNQHERWWHLRIMAGIQVV